MRARPLRVLHVTNHLADAGGAEVSLVQMLPHLQERNVESAILPLYSQWSSARTESLRAAGVVVLPAAGGRAPQHLAGVHRAIKSFTPDVVHSTLWDADLATRLVGLIDRVPVVVGLVNTQYSAEAFARANSRWRLDVYRRVDGLLARHATARFHALTEHAAAEASRALGVRRDSIEVIPRGRDRAVLGQPSPERRSRVRAALGISEEVPVILNLARQDTQKAIHELVEALAILNERHPDAVLLQAGRSGSGTPLVEEAAALLGSGSSIRFLGQRTDAGDLLAASDVFAFTSHWEGQGGAVLEAMAMNVPVVTYEVPAVLESTGGAGWSVPIGNVGALAAALDVALARPGDRRSAAESARVRFEELYEIGIVSARMAGMYRRVAGRSA